MLKDGSARASSYPSLMVVSDWPPVYTGIGMSSCIVLCRLFKSYPHDRILFVSQKVRKRALHIPEWVRDRLERIRMFPASLLGFNLPGSMRANILIQKLIARKIASMCRTAGTEVIFVSPLYDGLLLRPAIIAANELNIPLIVYFMDDMVKAYEIMWPEYVKYASGWQEEVLMRSDMIYVNGPGMQSAYRTRYGVESQILTNIVDLEEYSGLRKLSSGTSKEIPTIVYAGTVYGAQQDSMENLVKAIDIVNRGGLVCRLDIYSNLMEKDLSLLGWERPYISAKRPVDGNKIPSILIKSDILFLPLSFDPRWNYTVKTSAPGKLAEYAASGRPILIHAPPEADISIIGRERNLGIVVDRPDPALLAGAIQSLIENPSYAIELGEKALDAARNHYDQNIVQRRLYFDLRRIVKGYNCG